MAYKKAYNEHAKIKSMTIHQCVVCACTCIADVITGVMTRMESRRS